MRALCGLVVLTACAGSPGPEPGAAPRPSSPPSTASARRPEAAAATTCDEANESLAQVEALLAAGWLYRALGVMDAAEASCPALASKTSAARVRALVEIGDDATATALADRILGDASAGAEPKEAATAARALVASRAGAFADTDAAKAPMRKRYADGVLALDEKRFADAKTAYLDAWAKWHPNGQALFGAGTAAVALGQTVEARRLFDRATLELERATGAKVALDVPDGFNDVNALAWAPHRSLLGVGHGRRVTLLDAVTWRERLSVDAGKPVHALAFTGDGRSVIVGSDHPTLDVLSTVGGKRTATLEGHRAPVASLASSSDGRWIASGSWDETIRLWDPAAGKAVATLTGHTATVTHLAFDPKSERLASTSDDGTIKIWALPQGRLERSIAFDDPRAERIAFEDGGKVVAVATRSETRRFDVASGAVKPKASKEAATSGVVSDDGALRARVDRVRPRLLVEVAGSGLTLDRFDRHTAEVRGLAFDAQRGVLASAWSDGIVRWFRTDARSQRPLFAAQSLGGREPTIAFDVADGSFAFGASTGAAELRISPYGSDSGLVVPKVTSDGVARLAFARDGRTLAAGDWGGRVLSWTVGSHDVFGAHEGPITDLAFSSDGSRLASASRDQTVRVNTLTRSASGSPAEALRLEHPSAATAVAFSPDRRQIATGAEDGLARIWTTDGTLTRTLKAHEGPLRALAFSPDGQLMASAGDDARVALWSVGDGTRIRTLDGHKGRIRALAFVGDAAIASGSDDGRIILWDRQSGAILASLFGERGKEAGYVLVPSGHVELMGDSESIRSAAVCRVGALSYPFALCNERFSDAGLVPRALSHDGHRAHP